MAKDTIGMFLIGMALGLYMPGLPSPLNALNPFLGLALIIIGVLLFLKS